MPWKDIQEYLWFFLRPCVKGNNWISYITLGKTYCKSSKRLSVSETSLPCGLVVHINLVIACFVQASDDRLLKMRIGHHNQQLLRLINWLFPIIGTSLFTCTTLTDIILHFQIEIIQVLCETVARQRKVISTAPAFAVTLKVFKRV